MDCGLLCNNHCLFTKIPIYPSTWNNACYIMITIDRPSPSRIDGGFVYLFEEHVTTDEADGGGFVYLFEEQVTTDEADGGGLCTFLKST